MECERKRGQQQIERQWIEQRDGDENTRFLGKMCESVERERIQLELIRKLDQKFQSIHLEEINQNDILKSNNNYNSLSNNYQMNNFEFPQNYYYPQLFYIPLEKMLITDVINILKHSTINISLNSNKAFNFNIIKFWDNSLLKEIKYSEFENEIKNKKQMPFYDSDYSNYIFDNFEKLINFIKKIITIVEEKNKIFKFDNFEIKLILTEVKIILIKILKI